MPWVAPNHPQYEIDADRCLTECVPQALGRALRPAELRESSESKGFATASIEQAATAGTRNHYVLGLAVGRCGERARSCRRANHDTASAAIDVHEPFAGSRRTHEGLSRALDRQLKALAPRHRVVAVDLYLVVLEVNHDCLLQGHIALERNDPGEY